jgi:uncharacterized protein (TIGR02117 family)
VPDEVGSTTRVAGLLAAAALAAGCAAPVGGREPPPSGGPILSVRVVDHGWHTAIVVRRDDVDPTLWPEARNLPDAALVEVAWGDREFYMAKEATGWLAVKAALFTSGSVLHVAGLTESAMASLPAGAVVELGVPRAGFDAMTRFVHDEYQRDGDGRAGPLARGLDGASWFYAARSRYHLFNTCNTWVARALRQAGLHVTPTGTVTAGAVMDQARRAAGPP